MDVRIMLSVMLIIIMFTLGCTKSPEYTSAPKPAPATPGPCTLEPDPGPCRAAIPRYYFDPQDGCKEFTWGGCKGTVPFDGLEECESECGKIASEKMIDDMDADIDAVDSDTGTGDAEMGPVLYFRKRIQEETVKVQGGHPIEGFTPGMHMTAFPGFIEQDFDGVKASLGVYKIIDGRLKFIEDDTQPVHSAAYAITDWGYEKLLLQASKRMRVELRAKSSIDEVLNLAAIGRPCKNDDDCVTPLKYLARSSCPFTSKCVQEECRIACQVVVHDPNPVISESRPTRCEDDSECDCKGFTGGGLTDCACVSGECYSLVAA